MGNYNYLLWTVSLFVLTTGYADAQSLPSGKSDSADKPVQIRICTPSRGQMMHPPLYVVVSKNREFVTGSASDISLINPDWIGSINVFKPPVPSAVLGSRALYGVVEVFINDQKYPKVYRQLRRLANQHRFEVYKNLDLGH